VHEALWELDAGPDTARAAAEPEEERLVAALRAGDERAFEAIYRRQVGRVFGLAVRLTGDRTEAEELTQEVFSRAWQSRETFQSAEHLARWLRRVAVNGWINEIRRKEFADRRDDREEPEAADRVSPAPPPTAGLKLDLERALAALTPRLRAVLLLFDLYGHRHDEIAALLEITPGASKVRLHRARTRLREMLQ